jgi:hypothetical protein
VGTRICPIGVDVAVGGTGVFSRRTTLVGAAVGVLSLYTGALVETDVDSS